MIHHDARILFGHTSVSLVFTEDLNSPANYVCTEGFSSNTQRLPEESEREEAEFKNVVPWVGLPQTKSQCFTSVNRQNVSLQAKLTASCADLTLLDTWILSLAASLYFHSMFNFGQGHKDRSFVRLCISLWEDSETPRS